MNSIPLHRLRRLLCSLQDTIRATLVAAQGKPQDLARVAALTKADTIYAVDKISEQATFDWFDENWPAAFPVELVMEGCENCADEPLTFPRGTPIARTTWKCILDPIDGTRGYMYDKRPAWSLAALAPQRGHQTNLVDIVVAAMTELPTRKQWRADQFSAVRGCGRAGVIATACDVRSPARTSLRRSRTHRHLRSLVHPSVAKNFHHGFASLARYFPEGKAFIAQFEEELWRALHGTGGAAPLVFDDQYISTGGQLAEILVGHDRMVGDIRPMVYAKLRLNMALSCHPYHICTALIAREAGVIVEAPDGDELRAPLDTTTPISWVAYANPTLARLARPVFRRLIVDHL